MAGRSVSLLGRGGDTPAARWALNSFDRAAPLVLERGMLSQAVVDTARRALSDPGTRFWTPPAVAVWGWKGDQ